MNFGQINRQGILNGVGRRLYSNDEMQEGQFVNGELNGFGRTIFEDGQFYIGQYKNSEMNGQGLYCYGNGRIQQGLFENNVFKSGSDQPRRPDIPRETNIDQQNIFMA